MGKASRLKRLRKSQAARERALTERVQKSSPPGVSIIKNPPGHEKMSQILTEFARPVLDLAEDEGQYRKGLLVAIIAWNLACLPEGERIKDLSEHFPKALGEDGTSIVRQLVERKLALYPDIQRHIIDFELIDRGNREFHLSVVSSCDSSEPGIAVANP